MKEQGEEQKQVLLALAQEQRKAVLQESKEATKYIFKRKLHQRNKNIELGKVKKADKEKQFEAIKSQHLISSVTELNSLVAKITSLSLPKSLKNTKLRQIRTLNLDKW